MQCRSCGTDNPVGQKFCGNCGAPLVIPTTPTSAVPIAAAPASTGSSDGMGAVVRILTIVVAALLGLLVACGLLAIILTRTPSSGNAAVFSNTLNLDDTGTPSYTELCDPKRTANLTQAQGSALIDQLKGTHVSGWRRYVWQVDSASLFGATEYIVNLSEHANLDTWNIEVLTADKSALSLSKGASWEFSGKITDGSVVSQGVCMFYIQGD